MSSILKKMARRVEAANKAHRCSACFAPLRVLTAEQQAQARQEGYAQGMTDAQMDDPAYGAKICDACWRQWEAEGFPGMTRPN